MKNISHSNLGTSNCEGIDTSSFSQLTMQSNYYNTTTSPDALMEHKAVTTNLEDNVMDYDHNYISDKNVSRDASVEFAFIEPPNNHGRNGNGTIIT